MKTAIKVLLIIFLSLLIFALLVGGAVLLGRQLGGKLDSTKNDLGLGESDPELTDISEDFGTAAKALDIEVHAGTFKVVEGEHFRVDAHGVFADSFSCTLEGDRLVVRQNWLKDIANWLQMLNYDPEVTITVPQGVTLRELDLSVSAGVLEICDLQADDVDLDMSAGELKCGDLQGRSAELSMSAGAAYFQVISADSVSVNVSAGTLELKGVNSRELEADVSAGGLRVENLDTQAVEADCSAGSIRLQPVSPQTDWLLDMEISGGAVEVDGRSYSGDTVLGAKDALHRMELDLSAGQIVLEFP